MMTSVPRPVLKAINVKPIDQIPMTNPEQDLRLKAIAQNIAYLHENISLAYKEENRKKEQSRNELEAAKNKFEALSFELGQLNHVVVLQAEILAERDQKVAEMKNQQALLREELNQVMQVYQKIQELEQIKNRCIDDLKKKSSLIKTDEELEFINPLIT